MQQDWFWDQALEVGAVHYYFSYEDLHGFKFAVKRYVPNSAST